MKNYAIFLLIILALFSCEKDDPSENLPDVNTDFSIEAIQATRARGGGRVSILDPIIQKGLCWSTKENPTTADNLTQEGNSLGDFTSTMTGLTPATVYHVRAYAINSYGTSYGHNQTFTTADEPVITCSPQQNSIDFNGAVRQFTNTRAGESQGLYRTYEITGSGFSDINLGFRGPPVTGKYKSTDDSSDLEFDYHCIINCTISPNYWTSKTGGDVFIEKTGEDKYKITFCNVDFGTAGVNFTINAEGNITLD